MNKYTSWNLLSFILGKGIRKLEDVGAKGNDIPKWENNNKKGRLEALNFTSQFCHENVLQLYSGDVDKQKMLKRSFMTYTNCMHFCQNLINLEWYRRTWKKKFIIDITGWMRF